MTRSLRVIVIGLPLFLPFASSTAGTRADNCDSVLYADLSNTQIDISRGSSRDYLDQAMCSTSQTVVKQYMNRDDSELRQYCSMEANEASRSMNAQARGKIFGIGSGGG